jgi:hypothetical protein
METLSLYDSTYEYPASGISFSYPSGWAVDDVTLENMAMFYGPEVDGFITNVVFASEPWSGDTDSFADNQKAQMSELLTGYQLQGDGTTVLPAGVCRDLVYGYEIPGPTVIKARAVMLSKDGVAYAMVYTSMPGVYEAHLPQYEGMLSTFRLGNFSQALLFPLLLISGLAIGSLRDR